MGGSLRRELDELSAPLPTNLQRPWWRRHLGRLLRHAGWISLAVLGMLAVHLLVPQEELRAAIPVAGTFLQTFGAMYGIIVAFAMFVVWQEHNETQMAIEREAVSLGELHRILASFTSWPERAAVAARLRQYALVVPELNGAKPCLDRHDDGALLETGLAAFLAHAPAEPQEERLYTSALDLFHELNEAREHRLTVSRLRLPEGLRWFVFLGAGLCVGTMWLLAVESLVLHALLTSGMTWVTVAAASIVLDLDDPYSGDFVVDWGRFLETARQMDARAAGPSGVAPVAARSA